MSEQVKKFIRVDHAGEYGAARIYAGQLAVLGRAKHGDTLRHMKAQEQVHLDKFSQLIAERRVRPTALLPLWHLAGFALGAAVARFDGYYALPLSNGNLIYLFGTAMLRTSPRPSPAGAGTDSYRIGLAVDVFQILKALHIN